MGFGRISIDSREEWLKKRLGYQTASESAVIMGLSHFQSATELFDIKTGRAQARDISNLPSVRYGVAMEPLVREMALIENPYFRLEYHPYDILTSEKYPYMSATLDGELYVTTDANPWGLKVGDMVVYEGKTGSFRSSRDLERWRGRFGDEKIVPIEYWIQVLHQLIVTGARGALMGIRLHRDPYRADDRGLPETLHFYRWIDAYNPEVIEDTQRIIEANIEWHSMLKDDRRPPMLLSI